jgi:hypothetical protein
MVVVLHALPYPVPVLASLCDGPCADCITLAHANIQSP